LILGFIQNRHPLKIGKKKKVAIFGFIQNSHFLRLCLVVDLLAIVAVVFNSIFENV